VTARATEAFQFATACYLVRASVVGGIPSQVIRKHTAMLAHSIEGAAYQVRFLLSNPVIA